MREGSPLPPFPSPIYFLLLPLSLCFEQWQTPGLAQTAFGNTVQTIISIHDTFTVIYGHVQSSKNFESLDVHVPRWSWTQQCSLPSCFSLTQHWPEDGDGKEAVQCRARTSGSGASWTGFGSHLWHLFVRWPQGNNFWTLFSLLQKKIESSRMSF